MASRLTPPARRGSENTYEKSCVGSSFRVVQKAEYPYGQSVAQPKQIVGLPNRRTRDGMRNYAVLVLMANTLLSKEDVFLTLEKQDGVINLKIW